MHTSSTVSQKVQRLVGLLTHLEDGPRRGRCPTEPAGRRTLQILVLPVQLQGTKVQCTAELTPQAPLQSKRTDPGSGGARPVPS